MNRPRREGRPVRPPPSSSSPPSHRHPELPGTALCHSHAPSLLPWGCRSRCPPGRRAPSPSHRGTRLLDLELSGKHQHEPPYRISFGFHRAAISSLLSCGQERSHESANSTKPSRRSCSSCLPSRLGSSRITASPRASATGSQPPPCRHEQASGIFGWMHATTTMVHPQVPAGALLMVHTPHQARCMAQRGTRCSSVASPLLLAYPPPLPLPGCSLVLLVRPGRQNSPSATAHGCTSAALQENWEQPPYSPSDTCFLFFFLQQQQQQTPSMIRIIPPTTDIAIIRASKFTAGCKKRYLAHKYTAARSRGVYSHAGAPVTRLEACRSAWGKARQALFLGALPHPRPKAVRASFLVWLRQPTPHRMPTWGISPGIWESRWQPASSLQSIASVPTSRVVPHRSPGNGQVHRLMSR